MVRPTKTVVHVRATITARGESGVSEPYAQIPSHIWPMPMGRNWGDEFPVGTPGWAEYVADKRGGLWRFTPDTDEDVLEAEYRKIERTFAS